MNLCLFVFKLLPKLFPFLVSQEFLKIKDYDCMNHDNQYIQLKYVTGKNIVYYQTRYHRASISNFYDALQLTYLCRFWIYNIESTPMYINIHFPFGT